MTCKDCINYNICGEEKPYGNSIRTVCKANGWKLFKDKSKIIELPCKVGDVVYVNFSMQGWYLRKKNRPYIAKIVFIGINGEENFFNVVYSGYDYMFSFKFSDIGETVFLTREDAEKALERERK